MHRIIRVTLLSALMVIGAAAVASAATVSGKITKLDSAGKTFTVSYGKKTISLSLAADAEVLDAGKAISLAALKTGDRVRVEYADQGGQHLASKVEKTKATTISPVHPKKKSSGY